jgi:hypothetical protein
MDSLPIESAVQIVQFCSQWTEIEESALASFLWPCLSNLLRFDGIPEFALATGVAYCSLELLEGTFAQKTLGFEFLASLLLAMNVKAVFDFVVRQDVITQMLPLLTAMNIASQRRFLNNLDLVAAGLGFRNEAARDAFTAYLTEMEQRELTEEDNEVVLLAVRLESELWAVTDS